MLTILLGCGDDYDKLRREYDFVSQVDQASSVKTYDLIAALRALDRGDPDCARSLLNFSLDAEIRDGQLYRDMLSLEAARELLDDQLEPALQYREENPWDESAAQSDC